ncbi:DUF981 domain-containing protein [Micromonospora sp. WMMD1128]|uniref:DUF981 domain-containing protein n=1 Tax=unclassified Micromonospora TaxID=2617518 RepID=UPI00248BE94C|nr:MULTISPECIES: DUF981 domain-containing protein [unclassified Micromonospora]WBB73189.1 DUF981 domain-containing protein [Micromonospora sp. WMMD1128]WFE33355.1 DUF981 domain-containing protein [Micromonospora sp. WMMD975]
MFVLAQDGLKINWVEMPTYNTIMSVAAGVGLLLVVALGRQLVDGREIAPEGWSMAFAVLGALLTATGLHMTLTWPLASGGFAFDNIIFGEPALAFGVLLLGSALVLWRRAPLFTTTADGAVDRRLELIRKLAAPISLFVFALGLCCFAIAAAGWAFTLFAAPPEEPISGQFADYPWIEATFISGLYVLVGIGAVLFPFALRQMRRPLLVVTGVAWTLAGLAFMLFGALNYFTHIGLIVHTQ